MTTFEAIPISRICKGSTYITTEDGKAYPLDADEFRRAFDAIMRDDSHEMVTAGEAAQILDIPAKTVARILAFVCYGAKGNRMVPRAKVIAYRDRPESHGREALDDMHATASKGELDDIDYDAYLAK